jgi:hypothetical protein
MRLYRVVSFVLMLAFAATGLLFLLSPNAAPAFFNSLSPRFGMPAAPLHGPGFYLILAAGYMYVVTVLAFLMYRRPEEPAYPLLLTHAKLASSLLSLAFFLLHAHYLVYLANFIVDGIIGLGVAILSGKTRKSLWAGS